jgi:hypothetical protein
MPTQYNFNTNFSKKLKFLRLKLMCLWLSYKNYFYIVKVTKEMSRIWNWI